MADCATDPEASKRAQGNPDGNNSDNPPHSWKCATAMMEVLAGAGMEGQVHPRSHLPTLAHAGRLLPRSRFDHGLGGT